MTELSRRSLIGATIAGLAMAATAPAAIATAAGPIKPGQRRPILPATSNSSGVVIYQTSFEDNDPQWLTESTSYDVSAHHSGTQSLKYTRTDSTDYALASITIPFTPGSIYRASVYAKTAGLSGPTNRGARISLEGYNADGWINGAYSGNVLSNDWLEAQLAYEVPPDATSVHLSIHLYKGVTGTAWFDDLTVTVEEPDVLISELLTPSYRGLLLPGDHDQVSLRVRVGLAEVELPKYTVTVSIIDEVGAVIAQQSVPATAVINYSHPADALAVGRHTVHTEITANSTGERVGGDEWGIEKRSADIPATYIDRHGRLIRDGQPFFPIGFYNNNIDALTVQQLAGTPFNTILSYAPADHARLDLAAENGLSVIYSMKDFFYDSTQGAKPDEIVTEADEVPVIIDTVENYRDHPAMLAWYMNDELPIRQFGDRMIKHHNAVIEHDALHPTFSVHYKTPDPAGVYMRTLDVFGIDCYPVHGEPTDNIAECTNRTRAAVETLTNRAMWHVPQSFAWGALANREGRFPTAAEFRNMTWQFIAEGATGLIYWELYYMRYDPDLTFAQAMQIATTVAQEVAEMVPVILSTDAAPATTVPDNQWLNWIVKAYDGSGYLFAVNHTTDSQTATFTMPAAMSVEVIGEGRSVLVDPHGSFTDAFAAIAVHHYRITLPDYQSLADLTQTYLTEFGASNAAAKSIAAARLLRQAKDAAARGDHPAAAQTLNAYRTMITALRGRYLTLEQAQTLIRLSQHLPPR